MWRQEPLDHAIIALLKASKEKIIKEDDLYQMLKYMYPDVSKSEFLKTLLRLEVRGLIYVKLHKENSRIIKLRSEV